MVKISVVVPTYRRCADLMRCLDGIDRQEFPPYDVITVFRDTDDETRTALLNWAAIPAPYRKKLVAVYVPGVLTAMRAGTAAGEGEVVAYTDDDAVPHASWLRKISVHYTDRSVGGVGGRDAQKGVPVQDTRVGRVTWYGKLVGNHHIGSGPAREVDVLKGVNMSFRKELVEFPKGLMGSGAQVHFEVHVCLRIRSKGHRLIYDPEIVVDHYPAQRFDLDQRNVVVPESVRHAAFNLHLGILKWGGMLRVPFRIVYAAAIGDRSAPGLLRLALGFLRGERVIIKSFVSAQVGHWKGLMHYLKERNTAGNR